ncbi:MAG: hypothetical protein LLF76_06935 [Planctomycetaceae bacterium]|nr:hypothetical protein [Planctomycetaceae bacterium]
MNLNDYFEQTDGMGILSTTDKHGNVDCAIYAAPHIISEETVAFIMRPRVSYYNVQQNPKAAYMFVEKGAGYKGKRLYLQKVSEEADIEKINALRKHPAEGEDAQKSRLVYFKVIGARPLVGDNDD